MSDETNIDPIPKETPEVVEETSTPVETSDAQAPEVAPEADSASSQSSEESSSEAPESSSEDAAEATPATPTRTAPLISKRIRRSTP